MVCFQENPELCPEEKCPLRYGEAEFVAHIGRLLELVAAGENPEMKQCESKFVAIVKQGRMERRYRNMGLGYRGKRQ